MPQASWHRMGSAHAMLPRSAARHPARSPPHLTDARPAVGLLLPQHTANHALSTVRIPVKQAMTYRKSWQIFRGARCSPNRAACIAAAGFTPERKLSKTSVGNRPLIVSIIWNATRNADIARVTRDC